MTGKEFINAIANGKTDIIELLLKLLEETGCLYLYRGSLCLSFCFGFSFTSHTYN